MAATTPAKVTREGAFGPARVMFCSVPSVLITDEEAWQMAGSNRTPHGTELLGQPLANKDAAFTEVEREKLGLRGLLPWRVATLSEQVSLELEHLRRKRDYLEKYIGLAALQDRNEVLFHRLLADHLEELAPVVYTPVVGEACQRFSHVLRRPRGVWITPEDIARIPELLRNTGRADVRLIVVTDNERILGLGDLGAGGMGIPVGKLALYAAGAGVNPALTLPVSLDVGTGNPDLLADPLYLGYPKPRLRGAEYEALVDAFVKAVAAVYPRAVLQWEDFKQHNALTFLDRYRHFIPSFNDDIQGTAAVVLAGILVAMRSTGQRLPDQRIVILGAGAAGIGIARLLGVLLHDEYADPRERIIMLDSRGLLYEGREDIATDKTPFAVPPAVMRHYRLTPGAHPDLASVVRAVSPTILIGTSGVGGAFTEEIIGQMSARVPVPVVFPLSNPTSNSEATPADVLRWSDGRALVATGSPFDPVPVDGRPRIIGQANNMFVFPGIGLGAVVSGACEISDRMFMMAARTLAEQVTKERLAEGALYPPLRDLRAVSRAIAVAVASEARLSGLTRTTMRGRGPEAAVDAAIWDPCY
jgi:malate dehydrogenase (oxaloacetate-decarboxylating)